MKLLDIKIVPDRKNRRAHDLLENIQRNAQDAADQLAYDTAQQFKDGVEARLKEAGSRMDPLRESLFLGRAYLGKEEVYAVLSNLEPVDEDEIDKEMMVAFVVPKSDQAWLMLLEKESPWPWTMVPVRPKPSEAILVARKVRQDEMERLRAEKKLSLENILSQLRAYGIDTTVDTAEVEVEIVVDTAWEAIRAEFGLDGFRRVPVWQPALKEVLGDRDRIMRVVEKALKKPTPKPVDREVSAADLIEIRRFQDKVRKV